MIRILEWLVRSDLRLSGSVRGGGYGKIVRDGQFSRRYNELFNPAALFVYLGGGWPGIGGWKRAFGTDFEVGREGSEYGEPFRVVRQGVAVLGRAGGGGVELELLLVVGD